MMKKLFWAIIGLLTWRLPTHHPLFEPIGTLPVEGDVLITVKTDENNYIYDRNLGDKFRIDEINPITFDIYEFTEQHNKKYGISPRTIIGFPPGNPEETNIGVRRIKRRTDPKIIRRARCLEARESKYEPFGSLIIPGDVLIGVTKYNKDKTLTVEEVKWDWRGSERLFKVTASTQELGHTNWFDTHVCELHGFYKILKRPVLKRRNIKPTPNEPAIV